MWVDARALPVVRLNCGLVKMLLEEAFPHREEPSDRLVERITRDMGNFIAIQLNLGHSVSVAEAFRRYAQTM